MLPVSTNEENKALVIAFAKRPEFVALIVAAVVSVAIALGLPARAGLAIPETELGLLVTGAWAVFVGYVFEGRFSAAPVAASLSGMLRSLKFQALIAQLAGVVVVAIARAFGLEFPEDAVVNVMGFAVAAILGKSYADALKS